MSASNGGYYLPEPSHWPIVGSVGMFLMLGGFANFLHGGSWIVIAVGAAIIIFMLFGWFGTVINESLAGKYNDRVDMSFRLSMGWFIFSEVMFFAAFFGAPVLRAHVVGSMARRCRQQRHDQRTALAGLRGCLANQWSGCRGRRVHPDGRLGPPGH